MRIIITTILGLLSACGMPAGFAQVDIAELDAGVAGPNTKIAVLGSAHLSNMSDTFKPESLGPLLERLLAFKPDVITIEALLSIFPWTAMATYRTRFHRR